MAVFIGRQKKLAPDNPTHIDIRFRRDGTFGDLVGQLDELRVTCDKCGRAGRYPLDRLIAEHGRDAKIPDWLAKISGDCPKRQAASISDRCAVQCSDLLFGLQPPNVTLFVNQTSVPPATDLLCNDWEQSIDGLFTDGLSKDELCDLRDIIRSYVIERIARLNGITLEAMLTELRTFSETSESLLACLNGRRATDIVWLRIWRHVLGEHHDDLKVLRDATNDLMLSKFRSIVSGFSRAAKAELSQAGKRKELSHKTPWFNLVFALADLWESKMGRATASKGDTGDLDKASPFVDLVWTVMNSAVPESVPSTGRDGECRHLKPREHVIGIKRSMAGEISKILAVRKASRAVAVPMEVELKELKTAVEQMHNCTAWLVQSVPVTEIDNAAILRDGVVHVFDLNGDPAVSRAYAWSDRGK